MSPVTVYSRCVSLPVPLATTSPVAIPICARRALPEPGAERRHRALDCERREDRSFRIVAVSNRSAEDRHDAIADMLVNMATVILNDAIDLGEELAEKTVNLFLVELAAERGIAHEVGKEHSHLPAFALHIRESVPRARDRGDGLISLGAQFAMELSIFLRWPRSTPRRSRSVSVKSSRTSLSTALLWNASS